AQRVHRRAREADLRDPGGKVIAQIIVGRHCRPPNGSRNGRGTKTFPRKGMSSPFSFSFTDKASPLFQEHFFSVSKLPLVRRRDWAAEEFTKFMPSTSRCRHRVQAKR